MKINYEKKVKQILTVFYLLGLIGFSNLSAQEWHPIPPPSVTAARQGHILAVQRRTRIMLFGGGDIGELLNDTYTFDINGWKKLIPTNTPPPVRREHQAWIRDDKMYVYGGYGENGALDDLWSYNLTTNTWNEEEINGPKPAARYGHSATKCINESVIIVGGTGADGTPLIDCWKLNTDNTFTQLQDAPNAYTGHRAELSGKGGEIYVFGKPGSMGVYSMISHTWSLVPNGPPNGSGCMTSKGTNSAGEPVIFIFGGKDINGNEMRDVYEYNLISNEYTQREDMPQPTVNGSAARIKATPFSASPPGLLKESGLKTSPNFDEATLVFGGVSNGVVTNNTYLFSTQTPPDEITTIATADTVITDNVELFWNSASPIQASYYEAQLFLDRSANTLFADTVLADTTVTITGLNPQTMYYWRVRGFNAGGWGENSVIFHFYTDFVAGIEENINPKTMELYQNYPNPFSQSTIIKYDISKMGNSYSPAVQLTIYNLFGYKIATIVNEKQSPGSYKINFDASKLSDGIYYYSLRTGSLVQTKRMILFR